MNDPKKIHEFICQSVKWPFEEGKAPKFWNDLNAIKAAVQCLSDKEFEVYHYALMHIVFRSNVRCVVEAEAYQRCLAYCVAKGHMKLEDAAV